MVEFELLRLNGLLERLLLLLLLLLVVLFVEVDVTVFVFPFREFPFPESTVRSLRAELRGTV